MLFKILILLMCAIQMRSTDAIEPCTSPGTMCDGCESSYYCVHMSNGEWHQVLMDTCDNGRSCDQSTGACTADFNFRCHDSVLHYEFFCSQHGMFPDAYNCTKYHMCVPNEDGGTSTNSIQFECPQGFGYDALTTMCRIKLNEDGCQSHLPVCEEIGFVGGVDRNPSLYYVCTLADVHNKTVYLPRIFSCPPNTFFVGDDLGKGHCVPIETSLIGDRECTDVGYFYNSQNCESFLECLEVGDEPVSRHCPNGEMFDPIKRSCVEQSCKSL